MSNGLSLLDLSIADAQIAMSSGDLTAAELTQYYLDRILVYDDELNGTYTNPV